ncbi:hypothetical protein [Roseicyclus sp.]|uniref:hypothetical protein n=1 Tax=Roseicyclus sp. TaxID=1914329 RepID=UPI003F9F67E0
MDFAGILAGLLGALVGAVLIAGVIALVFRVFGLEMPRFGNLWKAAYLASAAVIIADGTLGALVPGAPGSIAVLVLGLTGAFFAYAKVLQSPGGDPMGNRAAALALGAHSVFSLAMFLLVFPLLVSALL